MTTTRSEPALALEGGTPARSRPDSERVPRIGTAAYGVAEREAVDRVLRDRRLWRHHGHAVAEFERRMVARLDGPPRALAVSSGTSALYLIFAGLDLPEGSEIILPTMGFVSAATAAHAAGLVPRYVPVDRSLGIDPHHLAAEAPCSAVLAVHPYGAACDLAAVARWALANGSIVVEDVAQALGATCDDRPLGSVGTAAALSFQDFKLLSTGEGGMAVSRDEGLADRMELMHDAAAAWTVPHVVERVSAVRRAPLNLRMSELEGALGLVQLDRVDVLVDQLRRQHRRLAEAITSAAGVLLRPGADADGAVGSSLILYLPTRDDAAWVTRALAAEGVSASLLLPGQPGGNRHWAGAWAATLQRCGAPVPPDGIVAQDRRTLESAVQVPVDLGRSERDVDETAHALRKVVIGGA